MREKRKGYPNVVSIGYKNKNKEKPIIICNIKELENISKGKKIFIGKIGKKKKLQIIKKANEMKLNLENINVKAFLKKLEKQANKEKEKKQWT